MKGEKVQLGQAGSCLRPAFLPAGWPGPRLPALPFTLPLSRDPVLACALPQLSESLDLRLLLWPLTPLPAQTSSVICSFVLVIILSGCLKWPSTTHKQSEREREFHLVNWVKVKKQKGYFYFFKQVTCVTCIGQPLDLIDPLVPMVSLIEVSKQRRKHGGFKASTLPPTSDLRVRELVPKRPNFQAGVSIDRLYFIKENSLLRKCNFSCQNHLLWILKSSLKTFVRKTTPNLSTRHPCFVVY